MLDSFILLMNTRGLRLSARAVPFLGDTYNYDIWYPYVGCNVSPGHQDDVWAVPNKLAWCRISSRGDPALWLSIAWSKPLSLPMKDDGIPKASGTTQPYSDGLGTGLLAGLAVGRAVTFASSCFTGPEYRKACQAQQTKTQRGVFWSEDGQQTLHIPQQAVYGTFCIYDHRTNLNMKVR